MKNPEYWADLRGGIFKTFPYMSELTLENYAEDITWFLFHITNALMEKKLDDSTFNGCIIWTTQTYQSFNQQEFPEQFANNIFIMEKKW